VLSFVLTVFSLNCYASSRLCEGGELLDRILSRYSFISKWTCECLKFGCHWHWGWMEVISGKVLSLMSIRYLFALSEVGSTQRKMQKLSWDKYWMWLPFAIFRASCIVILNLRWSIYVVF